MEQKLTVSNARDTTQTWQDNVPDRTQTQRDNVIWFILLETIYWLLKLLSIQTYKSIIKSMLFVVKTGIHIFAERFPTCEF